MLRVKYTKIGQYADGGILKDGFVSSEQAEQFIQDTLLNEPKLRDNILQLVQVDAEGEEEVITEYVASDFGIE